MSKLKVSRKMLRKCKEDKILGILRFMRKAQTLQRWFWTTFILLVSTISLGAWNVCQIHAFEPLLGRAAWVTGPLFVACLLGFLITAAVAGYRHESLKECDHQVMAARQEAVEKLVKHFGEQVLFHDARQAVEIIISDLIAQANQVNRLAVLHKDAEARAELREMFDSAKAFFKIPSYEWYFNYGIRHPSLDGSKPESTRG